MSATARETLRETRDELNRILENWVPNRVPLSEHEAERAVKLLRRLIALVCAQPGGEEGERG